MIWTVPSEDGETVVQWWVENIPRNNAVPLMILSVLFWLGLTVWVLGILVVLVRMMLFGWRPGRRMMGMLHYFQWSFWALMGILFLGKLLRVPFLP